MKLLDTAVLVDIDRGVAGDRVARLDDEGRHAISLVSVTELRLGLERQYAGEDEHQDAVQQLDRFLSRFDIIEPDRSVAVRAAECIAALRSAGEPVNDLHDVYIAATAWTQDIPVLTPNTDHFERMPEVDVQDWDTY